MIRWSRAGCKYLCEIALESILTNHRWEDLEEKPVEGQWVYFERK